VYVRGEAYLQAGKGQEAAAQFRKMLDHPGLLATSINGPLARLQLARSLVMAGDKEAAGKSYQGFLTLWRMLIPTSPSTSRLRRNTRSCNSRIAEIARTRTR
jgi:hypothetical protein